MTLKLKVQTDETSTPTKAARLSSATYTTLKHVCTHGSLLFRHRRAPLLQQEMFLDDYFLLHVRPGRFLLRSGLPSDNRGAFDSPRTATRHAHKYCGRIYGLPGTAVVHTYFGTGCWPQNTAIEASKNGHRYSIRFPDTWGRVVSIYRLVSQGEERESGSRTHMTVPR